MSTPTYSTAKGILPPARSSAFQNRVTSRRLSPHHVPKITRTVAPTGTLASALAAEPSGSVSGLLLASTHLGNASTSARATWPTRGSVAVVGLVAVVAGAGAGAGAGLGLGAVVGPGVDEAHAQHTTAAARIVRRIVSIHR